MKSDIKEAVEAWAKQIGTKRATGRLISRGVSARAAEQLCAGTYESEPKSLRTVLLDELAKDGFALQGEAS